MDLTEVPGTRFRRHPWEVARAAFFRRVLDDAGLLAAPRAILDVGAGDGYLARHLLGALPAGSTVLCLDANYSDDDLQRFAEPPLAGLAFRREHPAQRFDLILLLDVLEHVEDDRGFLGDVVTRNLAPAGTVLVSVPAWQALFSLHDVALNHRRRYRPADFRTTLAEAGLVIRSSGGLFHSLLIPRVLGVISERVRALIGAEPAPPANVGDWTRGPSLSSLLVQVLAVDNRLSRALARFDWTLPGLSLWALCGTS